MTNTQTAYLLVEHLEKGDLLDDLKHGDFKKYFSCEMDYMVEITYKECNQECCNCVSFMIEGFNNDDGIFKKIYTQDIVYNTSSPFALFMQEISEYIQPRVCAE
jgi:hypothetical protein